MASYHWESTQHFQVQTHLVQMDGEARSDVGCRCSNRRFHQAWLPTKGVPNGWSIPRCSSYPIPLWCEKVPTKTPSAFWVLHLNKTKGDSKKGWSSHIFPYLPISSHILPFFSYFCMFPKMDIFGLSPFVFCSTWFWGQVWAQTSHSPGAWMGCASWSHGMTCRGKRLWLTNIAKKATTISMAIFP